MTRHNPPPRSFEELDGTERQSVAGTWPGWPVVVWGGGGCRCVWWGLRPCILPRVIAVEPCPSPPPSRPSPQAPSVASAASSR